MAPVRTYMLLRAVPQAPSGADVRVAFGGAESLKPIPPIEVWAKTLGETVDGAITHDRIGRELVPSSCHTELGPYLA